MKVNSPLQPTEAGRLKWNKENLAFPCLTFNRIMSLPGMDSNKVGTWLTCIEWKRWVGRLLGSDLLTDSQMLVIAFLDQRPHFRNNWGVFFMDTCPAPLQHPGRVSSHVHVLKLLWLRHHLLYNHHLVISAVLACADAVIFSPWNEDSSQHQGQ